MDSLTHIVLGAVVGEAAVGKKMGNKALVYGAIAGSLPDFDVFVARFFDPVDALFVHRGFSHSLFLLVILAPLAAYAVKHFSHNPRLTMLNWLALIGLPWLSHILVDIFNTYGTAILEPFSHARISFDSVPIVDIFILLVLAAAVVVILLAKRKNVLRKMAAWASLSLTIAYFGTSAIIKTCVDGETRKSLITKGATYTRIHSTPLPLTNLIWMVVVEDSSGYTISQKNLINGKTTHKAYLARNEGLLKGCENNNNMGKLLNFTRGFYTVEKSSNEHLTIYDLRFSSLAGVYPQAFVFMFEVNCNDGKLLDHPAHPSRGIIPRNVKNLWNSLWQS